MPCLPVYDIAAYAAIYASLRSVLNARHWRAAPVILRRNRLRGFLLIVQPLTRLYESVRNERAGALCSASALFALVHFRSTSLTDRCSFPKMAAISLTLRTLSFSANHCSSRILPASVNSLIASNMMSEAGEFSSFAI